MAGTDRRQSGSWHFADAGSRFDSSPRVAKDPNAISPTFNRKILRCRRCGSRIVSNARRCPYCHKSVQPFYRSFYFWTGLVVLLAAAVVYFVFFYQPVGITQPDAKPPLAIGNEDNSQTLDLEPGTAVDCYDLIVTVISARQAFTAPDGRPIYEITVQFYNKTAQRQPLFTTQWVMIAADGSHVECYIGSTDTGSPLVSGVEGRQLAQNEVYTARLYFAVDKPQSLVFLYNSLETADDPTVSWLLAANGGQTEQPDQPDQSDQQPPEENAPEAPGESGGQG